MKVLSCFDGMSCGQIALERAGIKVDKYYASEIDKYAIQVTMKNYPDTVQLGSIADWQTWNIEKPDIIIGGSPCQGFSFAGKQLNFEDPRSKLFFTFVDILKYYKPKYFLLENVVMKAESNDVISGILGELYPECVAQGELFRTGRLEPIQINSALVSAQNRNRLYWTNIPGITQPKDKGILLKDIIENGEVEKCHTLSNTALNRIDRKTGYKPQIMPGKTGTLNTKNNSGQLSIDNGTTLIPVITGGAFRGRNPENTSDRTPGAPTEQRLEVNPTGKSNALTSVSKDSLCIQIGTADLKGTDSIKRIYSTDGKSPCLNTCQGGHHEPKIAIRGAIYNNRDERLYSEKSPTLRSERFGLDATTDSLTWRKLTPIECERLQTVPDNYTNHVSNSQRYKMLGNGWTVDVIAHIFKNLVDNSQ
jgi:site-specific DNA-cytosine methylase